jgi:membrane-associated phospholipid phosphatase
MVYGIALSCLWLLIYGGTNWITGRHDYRVTLRTRLDFVLPFVPSTAIVYLSLFPMLWLSPFVLRSPAKLRDYARRLAIVILVSGVGFLLIPAQPIDASLSSTNSRNYIFQFADWINLTHNDFPSLHVSMAIVAAACYSRHGSWKNAILYWTWASMIALSTLLTRQHYFVDAVAGSFVGMLAAGRVSRLARVQERP